MKNYEEEDQRLTECFANGICWGGLAVIIAALALVTLFQVMFIF